MTPAKALAAFVAAPIDVGGISVYPITLRYAAILEAVGSPVVTGKSDGVISCWRGTLYILTHEPAVSGGLLATGREAFDAEVDRWSDGISAGTAVRLIEAVLRQTRVAMGVNPDGDGDDAKNRPGATAG